MTVLKRAFLFILLSNTRNIFSILSCGLQASPAYRRNKHRVRHQVRQPLNRIIGKAIETELVFYKLRFHHRIFFESCSRFGNFFVTIDVRQSLKFQFSLRLFSEFHQVYDSCWWRILFSFFRVASYLLRGAGYGEWYYFEFLCRHYRQVG